MKLWNALCRWIAGEIAAARAETFQPELHPAFTVENPRIAAMVLRQRAYGRRLRREGRSLLGKAPKHYVPVLTVPGAPAERVTPKLRRVK